MAAGIMDERITLQRFTRTAEGAAIELPLSFEYLLATHRLWGPEPHLAVSP